MKLNIGAFAIAFAIWWGVGIFLATWWIIAIGGATGEPTFVARIYLGYEISALGSVIGLAWGFVDGLIGFIGDRISRWIRTVVPLGVAYFVAQWPIVADLFGEISDTTILAFVFTAYYSLVSFLETHVHGAFGFLLGRRV